MGSAIKKVGGMFGLGGGGSGSGAGDPNMKYFDIAKEIQPSQEINKELLRNSLNASRAAAPAQAGVLSQMGEAAMGRGPSLAEAQLKSASERNLAQQLGAMRGMRGGGASAQRAFLQNQAAAGNQLAQDAATARLQERANFLDAANQQGMMTRQDLSAQTDLAAMPKREFQQADHLSHSPHLVRGNQ